jgi:hypothetical protein
MILWRLVPWVLADAGLRPSEVATNMWAATQAQAQRIFDERPRPSAAMVSTLEASLINVTLYDRAAARRWRVHPPRSS